MIVSTEPPTREDENHQHWYVTKRKEMSIGNENSRLKRHEKQARVSTGTAIAVVVQMDVDRVTEFTTELFGLLLRKGTAGDHYSKVSKPTQKFQAHHSSKPTFECLLNIDSLLGTGLKVRNVPLGLAESHGTFR